MPPEVLDCIKSAEGAAALEAPLDDGAGKQAVKMMRQAENARQAGCCRLPLPRRRRAAARSARSTRSARVTERASGLRATTVPLSVSPLFERCLRNGGSQMLSIVEF